MPAGPIGGRRGSYASAALAEYPAKPYASCAPFPKYGGYWSAGGFTAAFKGAPAEPAPLAPDVGVTGFEIGVLGFSSNFFAEGVDALLDVPDLENDSVHKITDLFLSRYSGCNISILYFIILQTFTIAGQEGSFI